jgi:hypothetical protein
MLVFLSNIVGADSRNRLNITPVPPGQQLRVGGGLDKKREIKYSGRDRIWMGSHTTGKSQRRSELPPRKEKGFVIWIIYSESYHFFLSFKVSRPINTTVLL